MKQRYQPTSTEEAREREEMFSFHPDILAGANGLPARRRRNSTGQVSTAAERTQEMAQPPEDGSTRS